ncbi:MAG: AAA family ATPase [Pseudomonadota bacterium]
MRLHSFRVENFRSVREPVELTGLQAIEILHGPNNSGKSNLLRALDLAWKVLIDGRWWDGAPDYLDFPESFLSCPPSFFAHHSRRGEATRIGLSIIDPAIEAEFDLSAVRGGLKAALVSLSNGGEPVGRNVSAGGAPPLPPPGPDVRTAGAARLGLPPEPFRLVDQRRADAYGFSSWDDWLLAKRDADVGDDARQRFRAVERALAEGFPIELGPGRLDRYSWAEPPRGAGRVELAWESDSGVVVPFSQQGLGLQQAKDILCAVLGSPATVVAIEEPETNLSELAQMRLLEVLRRVTGQRGKQILLASHVHTFDGPGRWRIEWSGGGTTARRDLGESPLSGIDENTALAPRLSSVLQREYAMAGRPEAGWVSSAGLLRLPPSIMEAMELPEQLSFSHLPNGAMIAVPQHLLAAWVREEGGEE